MKKALACATIVLVGVLTALAVTREFPHVAGYPTTFSDANWREASQNSRLMMAYDLVERRLLSGRTRDQVISMLGQPNSTFRSEEKNREYLSFLVANLLWSVILLGDSNCLLIVEVDSSGTVDLYRVTTY